MSKYIPDKLRQVVYVRASGKCEYCLLSAKYAGTRHHIDHIIAEKHGGLTIADNLCLSCTACNLYKGSDIASIDYEISRDAIVALFHPRKQIWTEHFRLTAGLIEPLTTAGRVTVFLLRLNEEDRLDVRQRLFKLGHYP